MKRQKIGKSKFVSSRLAYGCMRVAGVWDPEKVTPALEAAGKKAIKTAYEAGYTLFDHADVYANGACETIFGKALKEVPEMRKNIIIATKCGIRWKGDPQPHSPHRWDFSFKHIISSCEQSLKRLGVDVIDIYQLHRPDYLADPQEIAKALIQLKKQGKVKEVGVSNFKPSLLTAVQKACPMPMIVNQVEISLSHLDCLEDGTLDQCLAENITPLSWSPLGRGLLGDAGKPDSKDPRKRGLTALVKLLDEMAKKYGVSRTVLSLAWLLKHPSHIIPIIGTVNPDRIKDAVKADKTDISREDWYTILATARMQGLP